MAIDGVYNISVKSPMGVQTATLTLKASGNTLTGTSKSDFGTSEITGTVNGDEFEWEEDAPSPMGNMHISAKGKVEGDKISGTMKGPLGLMPFEATKA